MNMFIFETLNRLWRKELEGSKEHVLYFLTRGPFIKNNAFH